MNLNNQFAFVFCLMLSVIAIINCASSNNAAAAAAATTDLPSVGAGQPVHRGLEIGCECYFKGWSTYCVWNYKQPLRPDVLQDTIAKGKVAHGMCVFV